MGSPMTPGPSLARSSRSVSLSKPGVVVDAAQAIAPGAPDQSFLLYRLASDDPGIMMPELGRGLVHEEGVALIREWIASLD